MYNFLITKKDEKDIYLEEWKEIDTLYHRIYFPKKNKAIKYVKQDMLYYFYGDIIENKNIERKLSPTFDKINIPSILELPGIYYLFCICQRTGQLLISNSIFSILPLFYCKSKSYYIIASNLMEIHRVMDTTRVNKRFILEQILFNYQFFNNTIVENIKLVPSNSYISISEGKFFVHKHMNIENYFVDVPKSWKKSLPYISDVFISESKKYFPDEKFWISFTSGFDGRTLVSCAKHYKKKFDAFSFGIHSYNDIIIPKNNSKELNINFMPIYLDNDEYIGNDFAKYGKELMELTSGQLSYIYSHFLYSSKIISQDSDYLLSGLFGSELLRAPHFSGAILSQPTLDFFSNQDEKIWIDRIRNSYLLNFLNISEFKPEIDSLISDLQKYKHKTNKGLNNQQKLYIFIFEEMLRKIFGNWIVAQSKYIKVRSPYLDFNFIKEILRTELAGVNNAYLTKNPIKRFKGQALYAEIIKKTSNRIYKQKTGKGYRPVDLQTFFGKIKILYPFFSKRLKKKEINHNSDILSISNSIKNINPLVETKSIYLKLFNISLVDKYLNKFENIKDERIRDCVIMDISLFNYLEKIKGNI